MAGVHTTRGSIDKYLTERAATGALNRKSLSMQRGVLYGMAEVVPTDPAKIRRRNVVAWLGTLDHLAANSRRLYHGIGRGYTTWLLRRGVLRKDPFADVPATRPTRPVHRALDSDQVAALVAAVETDRELLILMLGLHAGLRRAEIAALEVGDVSLAARTVTVRRGKGGHGRVVPLSEEATRVLARHIASNGLGEGPLLRSQRYPQRGIDPATVGACFRALAYRSGVKVGPRDGVGTHSSRHTMATVSYQRTGDVLAVSDLLGHSQLSTTQRYVRGLDVERLRAAVDGLSYLPAA